MTNRPAPYGARSRVAVTALAAVLAGTLLAGCGTDGDTRHRTMGPPDAAPMARAGASQAVADGDYLAAMTHHHEEAIASAGELARSPRPQMRALGRAIVASRTRQVASMRDWLARFHPGQPATTYHPMMRDLTGLSGDALDRAFLRDMAVHHMAAVMMSRHALAAGVLVHPQVAALARAIVRDQTAEIAVMTRWSWAWFGDRLHGMGGTGPTGLTGAPGRMGALGPMGAPRRPGR